MCALGESRTTRRELDGEGKTKAESRGISWRRRFAVAESPRDQPWLCWRSICGFAEPCFSVTGMHPGKLTGEPSPFETSSPEAVRSGGIRAVAVGTIGGFHLGFRIRLPVSAVAGPSDRARLRLTESAPILSLLSVKAATLLQASKSRSEER